MAFVKPYKPNIGDKVVLTKSITALSGTMVAGAIVTIVDIDERGYDIVDEDGNQLVNCGWTSFKPYDGK
jgi:hypothetical protein